MIKQDLHPSVETRLWAKVDKNTGHGPNGDCWVWTAGKSVGYGILRLGGGSKKNILAHRCSYILTFGKLDDNLVLRHQCDNPACVNPEHLKPGTQKENVEDMVERGRMSWGLTHCPKGHEYTPENTHRRASGKRLCLKCAAINANKRHQLKRQENPVTPKEPKTHCKRGHEYAISLRDKKGYCIECRNMRKRINHAKKKTQELTAK